MCLHTTGKDLRAILEEVESVEEVYDVTCGFLDLLSSLLDYRIPEMLGLGSRRPGILIYIEYIINEIILKVFQIAF